ncbi:MAG: PAS domain-containing protein [Parcubacteria group bacterium]|nr:PAS domain-containing protein [Parcubacteria group bacterium]
MGIARTTQDMSAHIAEDHTRIYRVLQTFTWGRWLLAACAVLVLALEFAPWRGTPQGTTILLRGGFLIALYVTTNLVVQLLIRHVRHRSKRLLLGIAWFVFIFDVSLFTLGVWVTGGIESPAFVLYFISLVSGALLFRTGGTLIAGLVVVALYTGLVTLEIQGSIPHRSTSAFFPGIFRDVNATRALASIINSSFITVTLLAALINRQLSVREDEVTRQRRYLERIIEKLRDGLIFLDEKKRIVFLNPRAEELLRTTQEASSGKFLDIGAMIVGDRTERDRITARLAEFHALATCTLPGVVETVVEAVHIPLGDTGNTLFGSMIILHDITREHALARTKSEFISIAAHQLRTPLSAIKWTMESVLSGEMGSLSDEQKKFLFRAAESNERMIHLVNDLLDVARIEEGRFGYRMRVQSIEPLVRDIMEAAQLAAHAKHVTLSADIPARALSPLAYDGDRLRLAFQNFLDNALSYTPEGGTVMVRVHEASGMIIVSFEDTGIGIPRHQIPRLFTKFFRAENAVKVKTDGTGLGLYLARNIIQRHAGEIDVSSEPGRGSVFTVRLPIKTEIPHEETEPAPV